MSLRREAGAPAGDGGPRWIHRRMIAVGAIAIVLLGALAVRAFAVQIDHHGHFVDLARSQHILTVEVPAPRGAIYDARGHEIAVTADIDSIYASPRDISDPAAAARALAPVLGRDPVALAKKLDGDGYFAWLERHVNRDLANRVKKLGIEGIHITKEPRRYYPGGAIAGPVIGFADIDGKGLDGIELSLDDLLAGDKAEIPALRDAHGNVVLPASAGSATPGAQVTLTLDRFIQYVSERALMESVTANDAVAGCAVVLDVATGSVLAMANFPAYDSNNPGPGLNHRARNRAITDVYEVGSVMKVFTIAAALDAGVVTPDTEFDIHGGRFKYGGHVFHDSYHDEVLDVGGILKRSSNVGALQIADRLGKERLVTALRRYGFGKATGIELPGERAGVVRKPDDFGMLGLATLSFGYGMTATNLQVAAALAAVGNGGIYHAPRIIREVRAASGEVLYRSEPPARQIMSPGTAAMLLPMMKSVFDKGRDGGTARHVHIAGYVAGGKTGTAHKVDPKTGQYGDHLYLGSFAGLAPIDHPRIAVVVIIDEPRGDAYYGAQVAAPVFASIVPATLRYLGLPAEADAAADDADPDEADAPAAPPPKPPIIIGPAPGSAPREVLAASGKQVSVPDFSGLGMARAIALAHKAGLQIETSGTGRAVTQTPPPGHHTATRVRITFRPERESMSPPASGDEVP